MAEAEHNRVRRAFDAIERAFTARSNDELDDIITDALADFGVTHFSVDQMRDASGVMVGIHHMGKWPENWGVHYSQQEHYRHDRIVRHALATPAPLRWGDAQKRGDLSRDEARLFGEAREFGLKDGYCTPVHQWDGALSAVSVHSGDLLELSPADEAAIQLLALHYCSYGMRLKYGQPGSDNAAPKLTQRQRECLQWVRAGKSSWEIGEILSVSERTVNFHIDLACRRLNVRTRNQAVIEAINLGLISL